MGLTCECASDWYPEPGDWCWTGVNSDYKMYPFKRKRKCCSCGYHIGMSDLVIEHARIRIPDSEVEVKIYGEDGEIPIASDWMCEECADLFLSLEELGYCVSPRDNMPQLVREYAYEHEI